MGLARTHVGWENEHLATFLLSRISFVASPATVADDVGTDLPCTLFEHADRAAVELLVPRNSIAAQVKSSRRTVDVAKQLEYLARLDIPHYIGVVDQNALTLDLFSGSYLPLMPSFHGRNSNLDFLLWTNLVITTELVTTRPAFGSSTRRSVPAGPPRRPASRCLRSRTHRG